MEMSMPYGLNNHSLQGNNMSPLSITLIKPEVNHRFPLCDAHLAHEAIEKGNVIGKVVLQPYG